MRASARTHIKEALNGKAVDRMEPSPTNNIEKRE